MKILLWDIETTPIDYRGWTLWPKSISHRHIIRDWSILCVAWKELGSKKTSVVSSFEEGDHLDDYNVVKRVHEVISDADILIAHNGDKFDLKMFNARVIKHDLPPLPPIATIDTLKEVKKISRNTSNRLDYLLRYYGYEGKMDTGVDLWTKAVEGDEVAMRKMARYCKQDVVGLEHLYLKLRPYMKSHPAISSGHDLSCPKCGSANMKNHKSRLTASGLRRIQYQCGDCGSYATPRYNGIESKSILK